MQNITLRQNGPTKTKWNLRNTVEWRKPCFILFIRSLLKHSMCFRLFNCTEWVFVFVMIRCKTRIIAIFKHKCNNLDSFIHTCHIKCIQLGSWFFFIQLFIRCNYLNYSMIKCFSDYVLSVHGRLYMHTYCHLNDYLIRTMH